MKAVWFFLLGSFLIIYNSRSISASTLDLDKLSQSREWLNLLHYGDGWIIPRGGSRVDRTVFFIDPEGKKNPSAELKATIAALKDPTVLVGAKKIPASCAFPARRQFLQNRLEINFPNPLCPELNSYLNDLKAERVALVFSTAYPNNPGSMFGHTFLKFTVLNRPDLLQPAVSYAALVGNDGGIEYAVRGLFGGYWGAFGLTPYYAKLNEYVRSESRDLWEYEMNLNPQEIKTLALHLWELAENAGFDYYFFDENCAFVLMRAVEVAKPEWDLEGSRWFTTPASTVRKLMGQNGAVKSIRFLPSLRRKLAESYTNLNRDEMHELQAVLGEEKDASQVYQAKVLDVALLELQYRKQTGSSLDNKIKKARSKLNSIYINKDNEGAPIISNRPDLGHGPMQLSLGGGELEGSPFGSIGFKFAFHDLLNSDLGYEPFSHIDFPSIRIRALKNKGLYLDRLGFAAITSLFPWTQREKSKSWKLSLDVRTVRDLDCPTCRVAHGDFGFGVALNPWTKNVVTSGFVSLYSEYGSVLNSFRFGPKVEWLSVLSFHDFYKFLFDAYWSLDAFQSKRNLGFWTLEAAQSFRLGRDWDLRMGFSRISSDILNSKGSQEFQASLQFYW